MTGLSPLPTSVEAGVETEWSGITKISGPRFLRMPVLTIGMLGLQMVWSVEMSYASPYLLSLGMSKSFMSVVFLAGPLSGLIVQPLIGVLSDRSRSRFGRRRPYILFGALISFAAMYLLGFTREFATVVTKKGSTANNALTIALAVWSIYCIDFSINAVQAMDRALLVDILPASEQERGNAWAGRMFGLGSVLGFFVGNVDLRPILPFFGRTQLEILCVVTSFILLLTHLVTIFNVKEKVIIQPTAGVRDHGLWHSIKDIWVNYLVLPEHIKRICMIQLFAWIGWFPVLFWTSLYVGGLHKRNSPLPDTEDAKAALNSEATRLGSRAMLCNSLASVFGSIVFPFFVSGADLRGQRMRGHSENGRRWMELLHRQWERRPTCHLAAMWTVSHAAFTVCMLSTFLITNVPAATVVMTLTGFSWAVTQWAPFALIAETIHTASIKSPTLSQYVLGNAEDSDDDSDIPLQDARGTSRNRISEEASIEDKAGIILGIHNVFVVIPQFIITGVSSILFAIMDPGKSDLPSHGQPIVELPHGESAGHGRLAPTTIKPRVSEEASARSADSVALIFRIGGASAAVACVLCWKLARDLKRTQS